jgi:hypothetical protein
MKISKEALHQLRLTMKSLGCVETTSNLMDEGNLRFNDPKQGRQVDYIIYVNTGVVRRYLSSGGYFNSWAPLNGKNKEYDRTNWLKPNNSSIAQATNEAELLLLAVRGVINYRNH